MTGALALCWSGVGLWLLADSARVRRLAALSLTPARARVLRLGGSALVLGAALPLGRELGAALAVAAWLVLVMSVLSFAVVSFPVRPRWFAASLPVALLVALASVVWG